MAVTVRKIFQDAGKLYHAKLIAGEQGLGNFVSWVHILEENEAGLFLRGREIVFTAGILARDTDWFLQFAANLHEVGASAFVINIGPYTKDVPQEVINFCNKVSLPLYTIPWETRMVDMTRGFCEMIIADEKREDSIATSVKNLIFGTGDLDVAREQLTRYGFRLDNSYAFLVVRLEAQEGSGRYGKESEIIRYMAERKIRAFHDIYVTFQYQGRLCFLTGGMSEEERSSFLKDFLSELEHLRIINNIHVGVSSLSGGKGITRVNFERALACAELAYRRHEYVLTYDELDLDRLLAGIRDKTIMEDYYDRTIGRLQAYDRDRGTSLFEFLKTYLDCGCSPQKVSELMYIHRNTVGKYLKRIEEIIGVDMSSQHDRAVLEVAFLVKDYLYELREPVEHPILQM